MISRTWVSHPVWVCGLKPAVPYSPARRYRHTLYGCVDWNRNGRRLHPVGAVTPCMGVWIETWEGVHPLDASRVTPCMGVWIETPLTLQICSPLLVTPCMGVWIETSMPSTAWRLTASHPVWVCGLKRAEAVRLAEVALSHPVWVCGLKPVSQIQPISQNGSRPVWVCGLKLQVREAECRSIRCHTLYGCVDWNLESLSTDIKRFSSHPVWVCGLKLLNLRITQSHAQVTPCMGVWIET